jgi:pimeloyl-ACP methyl ester carboxylesterase
MTRARAENSTNVRLFKWAVDVADRVSPSLASELALRAFLTPMRAPRPESERALLDVAKPLAISAAGLPLAAWSWGDEQYASGARRPTVLLVHGWAGRGAQLGALVAPLVNSGRRVVTWDAPAHGDTPGRTTTLAQMAEVLRTVAERVGPVEAIVAHSFGGAASTIALARGMDVQRAVYIAPLFTIGATVDRFANGLGLSRVAAAQFEQLLAHANMARRDDLEGRALAPAMKLPLLVVHDRDDKEVPYAEGVATVRKWPGAQLLTTGGLGHRRVLGDRDVVSAVVEYAVRGGAPEHVVLDDGTRIERELRNRDLRRVGVVH